ncbi:ABC transporter permease [Pseudorhizobium marinum]|uniref:ABC transporter permease n=1 Tax=Pseudorhizobium marinum TaxID=1496690 RepID=UPI000494F997|nr:ABC transporter permease [Pseudorhizobium marinum]
MTEKSELIIENGISAKAYWGDIWRHRELLLFLAWRDILVRYKQTVIGVSWVLIRPLLTMIILTVVFGRIANLSSGDTPYAILVFTGLLPWFYFSNATSESSSSLITNGNLLSKVYFPRMIVPASTVLVAAVDFIVSISVLVLLMLWYGLAPTWHLLLLPALGFWVGLLSLGIGLLFSALTVRYRDFRHIVPFVLQLGIYASPVGYSTALIPEKWAPLYYLNPIAGIIDAFRWSIIGDVPSTYGIISALIITVAVLLTGLVYFRSAESRFADDI